MRRCAIPWSGSSGASTADTVPLRSNLRRREAWPLCAVLALVLLDGCTLLRPAVVAVPDWQARRERLLALDAWAIRGRIAVKAEGGGGQGDLRWQQLGEAAQLRISGPFGAGAYDIRWDPMSLSIASRDGEFSRAWTGADATEQFLTEQLGWRFPATSIRYWLLGLPDPALAAEETFAADGQLLAISQDGWTVSYERFAEQDGMLMPTRLTVLGPGIRVRLVVDRWEF